MYILNIFLIVFAVLFFYALFLQLTEMKPPSSALNKKTKLRTLLDHANGREIIGTLSRTISEVGGCRLVLIRDGWHVFSEPLNLFSYGYYHLIGITDNGIEIKTVCRQQGSFFSKTFHSRFVDIVRTMIALDFDET